MRIWVFWLCILCIGYYDCLAQTTPNPPVSQPTPTEPVPSRRAAMEERRRNVEVDEAFSSLRSLEIAQTEQRSIADVMSEDISPLYRSPGRKKLTNLWPDKTYLTQYEKFLRQPDTGIFKLSGETVCAGNAKVVVATEKCLLNDIPGAGTAYSFRIKSHRLVHLSDLILEKGILKTDSILQQGILVNLGSLDLAEVTSASRELKFLLDFKPAANRSELEKYNDLLAKGIKVDGLIYSYGLFIEDKATYALRSIAYGGKILRSINGVSYNEMDYDKRKDIIVVFTILEREANGNVTILWKLIQTKDSPRLELKKD